MSENRTILGANAISVPSGNTAQRPASPAVATLRYNTDTTSLEIYNGSEWKNVN
jgi:hypothetical protein